MYQIVYWFYRTVTSFDLMEDKYILRLNIKHMKQVSLSEKYSKRNFYHCVKYTYYSIN